MIASKWPPTHPAGAHCVMGARKVMDRAYRICKLSPVSSESAAAGSDAAAAAFTHQIAAFEALVTLIVCLCVWVACN